METSVLVVIPVYNEEQNLPELLEKLGSLPYPTVWVNDGSTDHTSTLLQKAGQHVLHHMINRGVGAATQTGFDYALSQGVDYAVTFDGDGQHAVEDISMMVETMKKTQVDVLIGSRFLGKNTIPLRRRLYNKIGNIVTFCMSGLWLSDSQSGFKVFSKKALEKIKIHANGYEFCSEIIREMKWFGLTHQEVPIHVTYSKASMAKGQNFSSGVEMVVRLLIRSLTK